MSKPNGVGFNGQLNSGSLHQQTRRNPLGGVVRSPVENHDLCHHYQIKPGQTQFNQHNGHCIRRCSTDLSEWFTPHEDLFVTRLTHKLPLYVSPFLLPDHCNSPRLARGALVLGPSAVLYRDPTSASSVNYSSQTVPQLCASQQATTSQPQRLVSRSEQLQEQRFSVEVAERIAAPQRSSTKTIYNSKWALFEKWY